MTTPSGSDPHEQLRRAVDEAFRPVFEQMSAAIGRVYEQLGGAEGIARIVAAVEEAKADRARWEAEHPGLRYGATCHCLCARWGAHECGVDAETTVTMVLQGDPVQVPMCPPCAAQVRARVRRGPAT